MVCLRKSTEQLIHYLQDERNNAIVLNSSSICSTPFLPHSENFNRVLIVPSAAVRKDLPSFDLVSLVQRNDPECEVLHKVDFL